MLLCVLPLGAREWQSVIVNEDSTVSFCYCGVGKRVSVYGDFFYAGEDSTRYTDLRSKRVKMKRQSDGCFHATTRPIQSEVYTYCFKVNGKRKNDPLNNDTAWQMTHKWNIVTVGGTAQTALYQQPAQRGTMLHTSWYSSAEKLNRQVNIYLPAGYNEMSNDKCQMSNNKYPVLYLLHGISGYEGSWSERGRAIQILENLVAQGKCSPMILVMPDVNVKPQEGKPTHRSLFNNIMNYSRLCHDHDIERALVELTAFVDSTFRVSDDHFIAGLSDGARMAANTANMLPNYFSAVGLFSPVVHKKQLPKQDNCQLSTINYQLPTYYVYSGKSDMFHGNAKRFNRRLTKAQAPHEYTETIGGHTWRNWRLYLSDFLVKINQ
jgi:enterochelin esterase family protein